MLITIRVPDNAVKIFYSESDGNGYESEPRSVTMGMIKKGRSGTDRSRILEGG